MLESLLILIIPGLCLPLTFLDCRTNLLFQGFDISILLLPDLGAQKLGQKIDIALEEVADAVKVVEAILAF